MKMHLKETMSCENKESFVENVEKLTSDSNFPHRKTSSIYLFLKVLLEFCFDSTDT